MHDFSVIEPEEMHVKVLANATGYYKKDKEGIQAMCKAMEDMITDYVTEENWLKFLLYISIALKTTSLISFLALDLNSK